MTEQTFEVSSDQRYLIKINDNPFNGYHGKFTFRVEVSTSYSDELLEDAVVYVMSKHPIFRIKYFKQGTDVFQHLEPQTFRFNDNIAHKKTLVEAEAAVENFVPETFSDLHRVIIYNKPQEYSCVFFAISNTLLDSTSASIITEDILAFLEKQQSQGEEPYGDFIDFVLWQNDVAKNHTLSEHAENWGRRILKSISPINFPFDHNSSKPPGGYKSVTTTFNDTFIAASRSYCQKYGLRDSSIFLASWYIFLYEITGERDLGGGVVFDQRTSPQLERVAGPLSNILPHRIWMDDDTVFEALIMQINADLMVMEKMKHFPFSDVFTRVNEIDDDELVQFLGFRFQHIKTLSSSGTMKFPLSTGWPNTNLGLICVESEFSIQLQLSYDESTIDRESAETYIAYLEGIATMLVEDPGGKLLNVRNTLFKNSTQWPPVLKEDTQNINPMVTLADLFEDQVSRTPSAVALDFEGNLFTYKQVNDRANEIAHALIKEYQIQPDDLVGVAMDRSEHLIFSILGILKAGAAYVPIDISFPISRKMEIIDDCQCKIVLVDNATDERYVLPCETRLVNDIYHPEFTNPRRTNTGDNLAYVIYSSGTTGKPKGIMVEHSPVVNLLDYYNTKYNLKQPTNIVQLTNIAVDIALQEIFSALSNGHTLFMPSSDTILSKENFNLYLTNNRISFIQVIPDFLRHYLVDADVLPFLKTILCGGDKLDEQLKNAIIKKGYNLYNVYGQTETAIDSLVAVCDVNSMVFTDVLPGYQVMVFDEHTQLVLPGTIGEICTAGIGLARGYLNQPELTHEKFSPAILPGKRVYRTGDRAKICGKGKLKFQGRSDRQVKIRGFRVELSEIEKCIESCQGVLKAAVTVIVNNGDKNIIAYIVSKETTAAEVLAYISLRLPDYMVPSRVEIISAFALLPSGKIDFKKLKTVEPVSPTGLLALPATDIQKKLSVIWMEVLSKQQIGIYDDFFQLGGHSLKIVQIISRIQNVFGVKLPFKTLFTSRTISDLSEVIAVGTQSNLNINRTPEAASYGLSYAQKRLYILQQSPGSGLNFNIPLFYTFGEGVDEDALHKVFIHLFERHESLRTCFKIIEGEPRQIVKKMPEIAFTVTTYREEDEGKVRAHIDEKVNERFDLEVAPLLRCYLIETAESKIQLLVVLHHIIADGWSIEILEKEFSILWQSNTLNKSQLLTPLKIQYRDFSTWEDQQIESSGTSHRMFWQKQFAHGVPRLNFPTYKARPSRQTFNGDNISVSIKKDLTQSIQQFSASNGNTIFITLVSLLDVLMYKYTGQKDFTYGTPVAGRYQSELESQVGYFLNILPLRTQIEQDATFLEHVTKTKGVIVDAYEHQAYPVDLLLEDLNITRDLSRSNIFDVLIILQNYHSETISVTESDIETTNFDTALNKSALFDLTFEFNEVGDSLNLNIIYNTDLFSSIQIKEMSTAFLTLIAQVISSPTVAVRTVSLPQSQKVPTSMGPLVGDASSLVGDFTLVDRFEHWTKVNPNHSAVSFKNRNISYGLLNKLANRLAWELRAQHTILPDDRIGILTSRSDHMVIAVLAVLKSGAAFVPIDNEFPIERINYIIEDCQLRALIVDDPDVGAQFSSSTIVHLLSSSEDVCESQSHNLNVRIDYHHLAYVIYTSGSTGKPKGVMIEHGNVCSAIKAWEQSYHLMDFDVKLLQLANFAFDVFVGDLCRSLCVGGTMFICPSETKLSLPDLLKYIITQKINILEGTPALLVPLLDVAFEEGLSLDDMRVFVLGSDTCSWEDFKRIGLRFGHAMRIINSYGTTENTIDSSFYEWTPTSSSPSAIVPIGRPLLNTELLILDDNLDLRPTEIVGELAIGGQGVARGYLNQPELTFERFVPNPHNEGGRMFKSHDLACWLADGNVLFLGRSDSQVKVSGYRIELGEIERVLTLHPEIRTVIVDVIKNANDQGIIVAFIIGKQSFLLTDLRSFMLKFLPAYMIPAKFVFLDALPVSNNGKVDKRALIHLIDQSNNSDHHHSSDLLQEQLVVIWKSILKVEIDVDSNFFELGGNSIKATKLVAQIYKNLGVIVSLKEVFLNPTIREIATRIGRTPFDGVRPIAKVGVQETHRLSYGQQRLWIGEKFGGSNVYAINLAYRFSGEFDVNAFVGSFTDLVDKYEILRATFCEVAEQPFMRVLPSIADSNYIMVLPRIKSDDEIASLVVDFTKRRFDLEHGPLVQLQIIPCDRGQHVILFRIHHIISDLWSLNLMFKEMSEMYNARIAGRTISLQVPELGYKDYVEWYNSIVSEEMNFEDARHYWLNVFDRPPVQLQFPYDYSRPAQPTGKGNTHRFILSKTVKEQVETLCIKHNTTLFTFLLSCVKTLLFRITAQTDIVIGVPVSGRFHPELEEMLGFFINTLPIRTRFNYDDTFRQLLLAIRTETLQTHQYQYYPFDKIIEQLGLKRDFNRNPLFDVRVVMQNWETSAIDTALFHGVTIEPYQTDEGTSMCDLRIIFTDHTSHIDVIIEYSTDLFNHSTIKQIGDGLMSIVDTVVSDISISLKDIPLSKTPIDQQTTNNIIDEIFTK